VGGVRRPALSCVFLSIAFDESRWIFRRVLCEWKVHRGKRQHKKTLSNLAGLSHFTAGFITCFLNIKANNSIKAGAIMPHTAPKSNNFSEKQDRNRHKQ
jgi:hypothetical protein